MRDDPVSDPLDPLLGVIEAFLGESGLSASAFGLRAVNDPRFVHEVRAGREVRRATRARVAAYLEAARAMAAERRQDGPITPGGGMRPSKYDWQRIDPQVDAMLAEGMRIVQVARVLEMQAQTLRDRLSYRRRAPQRARERRPPPPALIDRSCLNCRVGFQAPSPFLRLCPVCRAEC